MTVTPADLARASKTKLAGLSARFRHVDLRQAYTLEVGQRVWIPGAFENRPHWGTVTRVEPTRFRVTWDSEGRKSGQARERFWYSWGSAHNFKRGEQ